MTPGHPTETPLTSHRDPSLSPKAAPGTPGATKAAEVTPGPALLWGQGLALVLTHPAELQTPSTHTAQCTTAPRKAASPCFICSIQRSRSWPGQCPQCPQRVLALPGEEKHSASKLLKTTPLSKEKISLCCYDTTLGHSRKTWELTINSKHRLAPRATGARAGSPARKLHRIQQVGLGMSHPCIPWLLLPPTQLLPASHPGWMPTGMAGELPEAAGSQGSWMGYPGWDPG